MDPEYAPPIQQYEQLTGLYHIQELKERFAACTSSSEMKDVWAEINPQMQRVKELVKSVKDAATDIVNAEKARRRTSKVGKADEAEKAKSQKAAVQAELRVPFGERLANNSNSTEIPSTHFRDWTPLRALPESPMIVRGCEWSKEVLKGISTFKQDEFHWQQGSQGSRPCEPGREVARASG